MKLRIAKKIYKRFAGWKRFFADIDVVEQGTTGSYLATLATGRNHSVERAKRIVERKAKA